MSASKPSAESNGQFTPPTGGGGATAPGDSIILEEEIDPNYVPTVEEVREYAKWLGMDLEADSEMFWIAKEGLKAPLPANWKPCKTMDTEEIYYFNFFTGESTWDHPCDEYYRKLYDEEKKKRLIESKTKNDKVKQKAKEDVAQLLGKDGKKKRRNSKPGSSAAITAPSELGSIVNSPRSASFDRKPLPGIAGDKNRGGSFSEASESEKHQPPALIDTTHHRSKSGRHSRSGSPPLEPTSPSSLSGRERSGPKGGSQAGNGRHSTLSPRSQRRELTGRTTSTNNRGVADDPSNNHVREERNNDMSNDRSSDGPGNRERRRRGTVTGDNPLDNLDASSMDQRRRRVLEEAEADFRHEVQSLKAEHDREITRLRDRHRKALDDEERKADASLSAKREELRRVAEDMVERQELDLQVRLTRQQEESQAALRHAEDRAAADLASIIERSRNKVAAAEADAEQETREQVVKIRSSISGLTGEAVGSAEMEAQLQQAQRELAQARKHSSVLETSLKLAKADAPAVDELVETLRASELQLRVELDAATRLHVEETRKFEVEIQDLRTALSSARSVAQAEASAAAVRVKRLEEEAARVFSIDAISDSLTAEDARRELEIASAQIAKLLREVTSATALAEAKEQERSRLAQQMTALTASSDAERSRLAQQVAAAVSRAESADGEVTRLKKRVADLVSECEQDFAAQEGLRAQIRQTDERSAGALKAQSEQVAEAHTRVANIEAALADARAENQKLSLQLLQQPVIDIVDRCQKCAERADQEEQAPGSHVSCRAEAERLRREVRNEASQRSAAEVTAMGHKHTAEAAVARVSALESELAAARDAGLRQAAEAKAELSAANARVVAEVQSQAANVDRLIREACSTAVATAETEKMYLQQTVAQYTQQAQEAQECILSLKQSLSIAQTSSSEDRQSLERRLDQERRERSLLEVKFTDAVAGRESIEAELRRLTETLLAAQEAHRMALDTVAQEQGHARVAKLELQDALARLRGAEADANLQLGRATALMAEVASVRAREASLQEALEVAQAAVRTAEREKTALELQARRAETPVHTARASAPSSPPQVQPASISRNNVNGDGERQQRDTERHTSPPQAQQASTSRSNNIPENTDGQHKTSTERHTSPPRRKRSAGRTRHADDDATLWSHEADVTSTSDTTDSFPGSSGGDLLDNLLLRLEEEAGAELAPAFGRSSKRRGREKGRSLSPAGRDVNARLDEERRRLVKAHKALAHQKEQVRHRQHRLAQCQSDWRELRRRRSGNGSSPPRKHHKLEEARNLMDEEVHDLNSLVEQLHSNQRWLKARERKLQKLESLMSTIHGKGSGAGVHVHETSESASTAVLEQLLRRELERDHATKAAANKGVPIPIPPPQVYVDPPPALPYGYWAVPLGAVPNANIQQPHVPMSINASQAAHRRAFEHMGGYYSAYPPSGSVSASAGAGMGAEPVASRFGTVANHDANIGLERDLDSWIHNRSSAVDTTNRSTGGQGSPSQQVKKWTTKRQQAHAAVSTHVDWLNGLMGEMEAHQFGKVGSKVQSAKPVVSAL